MIIGIDPGKTGALVAWNEGDKSRALDEWDVRSMPTLGKLVNYDMLCDWINFLVSPLKSHNDLVIIEKQQPFPKQGLVSTASIVGAYREIVGICRGLGLPFQVVRAQDWKKVVLCGRPWKGDKQESVRYVQERYPSINLLRTEKCRKPSDGIADAVCMVEYGKWLLAGRPSVKEEGDDT